MREAKRVLEAKYGRQCAAICIDTSARLIGRSKGKEKQEDRNGKAHCEESETVGVIAKYGKSCPRYARFSSTKLWDLNSASRLGGLRKITHTLCGQFVDLTSHVTMVLPEHLSHLEAGGHRLVVLKDGHEVATF